MIDNRCSDRMCKDKGIYHLTAKCLNCGTEDKVKLTKGHDAGHGPKCRQCGSARLSFGDLVYVS